MYRAWRSRFSNGHSLYATGDWPGLPITVCDRDAGPDTVSDTARVQTPPPYAERGAGTSIAAKFESGTPSRLFKFISSIAKKVRPLSTALVIEGSGQPPRALAAPKAGRGTARTHGLSLLFANFRM